MNELAPRAFPPLNPAAHFGGIDGFSELIGLRGFVVLSCQLTLD
ncbi:MAG: hypothetical protein AAGF12_33485 [Myxococcota bacterium]